MEQDKLERRIAALEERLGSYHDWLEASLDRDRKAQLELTWGVITSGLGMGSGVAIVIGAEHWFPKGSWLSMDSWTGAGAFWLVWYAMIALIARWAVKAKIRDEGKLSRLPQWKNVR